jgi:serine protease DegS
MSPGGGVWLGVAVGGLAGAALVAALGLGLRDPSGPPAGLPRTAADRRGAVFSYADAVARAAPSVVNIFTSKLTGEGPPAEFRDPALRRWFGGLLPEQTRRQMETSLGSGVVVDGEGHVLTNLHILEGADEISVLLADGSHVEVRLVGRDPDTDLAVLRLAAGLRAPPIPLGDARRLRVGDVALAIGNPFGVGQTVTLGIVSATGRTRLGISSFENFIQTDAAINPGNSGGALIDARGDLIGINTAIFSRSGGSHGVGFAIPVNLALNVRDQLKQDGRVVRGWIGISGQDVTAEARRSFALKSDRGVLVSSVLEDGPAARAGLRPGDVITRIDQRPVENIQDLLDLVAGAGPGKRLAISGLRGSDGFEYPIVTAERP